MNFNSGKALSSKWTIKWKYSLNVAGIVQRKCAEDDNLDIHEAQNAGERENRWTDDYSTMHIMAEMIRKTHSGQTSQTRED